MQFVANANSAVVIFNSDVSMEFFFLLVVDVSSLNVRTAVVFFISYRKICIENFLFVCILLHFVSR